jgi:hypothetical protein
MTVRIYRDIHLLRAFKLSASIRLPAFDLLKIEFTCDFTVRSDKSEHRESFASGCNLIGTLPFCARMAARCQLKPLLPAAEGQQCFLRRVLGVRQTAKHVVTVEQNPAMSRSAAFMRDWKLEHLSQERAGWF